MEENSYKMPAHYTKNNKTQSSYVVNLKHVNQVTNTYKI